MPKASIEKRYSLTDLDQEDMVILEAALRDFRDRIGPASLDRGQVAALYEVIQNTLNA